LCAQLTRDLLAIAKFLFCLKHTVPVITDAQALQTYFYTTWVWGVACQNNFRTEIGRGQVRGVSPKVWDPLFISETIEASNFKFGTQRGFGEYVTITALVPNLVGAGWSTGAPQKLCGPGTM